MEKKRKKKNCKAKLTGKRKEEKELVEAKITKKQNGVRKAKRKKEKSWNTKIIKKE